MSNLQDLNALWLQAVKEFNDNAKKELSKHRFQADDPDSLKKNLNVQDWEHIFSVNAPNEWKQTFEKSRNPESNATHFRTRISNMLEAVQAFASPFGMVLEGAATAYPAMAPAVVLMKGLFWVMKTFSSVSMRFDKFFSFCDKIKTTFENISIFNGDDLVKKLGPIVSHHILDLFKSVLRVYILCIEEPKKRAATWWHIIIKGNEDIEHALSAVDDAKISLNELLTTSMVVSIRSIQEQGDKAEADRWRLHEESSVINTQRHTEIISQLSRIASGKSPTQTSTPKSKDPAARKDVDIMWLREQLSGTDQSRLVQDLRAQLVPDAVHWLLRTEKITHWTSMTGPRTLWISGAPGSGKTYLALSIVEEVRQKPDKSLAYFFFREDQQEFRDLGRALSCMVVDRAENDLDYRKLVIERLRAMKQEARKGLTNEDIWKEFFIGCQPEKKQQTGLCVILDGIDEGSKDEENELLALLSGNSTRVCLLITARNGPRAEFQEIRLKRVGAHFVGLASRPYRGSSGFAITLRKGSPMPCPKTQTGCSTLRPC